MLVESFGLADPAEEGLGSEMFFCVFEIFFEDEVDFSNFAVVYVRVEGESVVEGVQDLSGVEALDGGVEEASVA